MIATAVNVAPTAINAYTMIHPHALAISKPRNLNRPTFDGLVSVVDVRAILVAHLSQHLTQPLGSRSGVAALLLFLVARINVEEVGNIHGETSLWSPRISYGATASSRW